MHEIPLSPNGGPRRGKNATPGRLDVFLAAIIVLGSACSHAGRRPLPAKAHPHLRECVIIQTEPPGEDLNLEAYTNALDAVALNWKIESPAAIKKLTASESKPILIIPMRAARSLTTPQIQSALNLIENGAILVSEGITPLSEKLGFRPGKPIPVEQLEELAYPNVEISWEKKEQVTPLLAPGNAAVLNRERKSHAPLVCLLPYGRGRCLLLAAELDPWMGEGYARFPYLLQELRRAGADFPFRCERLSALFDYAYRLNENPDALASAWREIGIQALHVGAWDFYDGDKVAEAYLRKLIDACHRNGILVYAWLELPHVSDEFWKKHPGWHEKTATGRDANIDWRSLMNLRDPQCYRAVAEGLKRLFRRFDWDGANLAELYFDSPSGTEEPESFTPLNALVRADFRKQSGIDPLDFFRKESPRYWKKNSSEWGRFVDYRVALERDLNERFIRLLSGFRGLFNPDFDVVVTYVDNIYDSSMRAAVGADVHGMFGLLDRYDFTLVLEDPGTVWNMGPRRYAELGQTYSKLTRHAGDLGIDINIVDRDVTTYPTQKQTGTEFLELFHQAGRHFQTVMAYAEQTMAPQDASLVACALAPKIHGEIVPQGIRLRASAPFVYRSGLEQADFNVDGDPWPCLDKGDVHLPAGSHLVSIGDGTGAPRPRLIKLNGNLAGARYRGSQEIEFSYNATRRAIVIFSRVPKSLQVDGVVAATAGTTWAMLPRGSHKVLAAF